MNSAQNGWDKAEVTTQATRQEGLKQVALLWWNWWINSLNTKPLWSEIQNIHFLENAKRYEALAKLVGQEIANRSIKLNIANRAVKDMLVKIVAEINEQRNPTALPVIIGF